MKLLINLLVNALAVFITAYILTGVAVDTPLTAVVVAIVLGAANTFIKPILTALTLPITVLTFGLFTLVINAALVYGVAYLVAGFSVADFLWALAFSVVLTLINSFLQLLTK